MPANDSVLAHLKARGIKPQQLQRALDVSPSAASRMLKGLRGIPRKHLDAIAALLQMTVADLFVPLNEPNEVQPSSPGLERAHGATVGRLVEELLALSREYVVSVESIAGELAQYLPGQAPRTPTRTSGGKSSGVVRRPRKVG